MQLRRDGQAVSAVVREAILRALSGIRFGVVQVVVHDGQVVAIERTERLRLERDK